MDMYFDGEKINGWFCPLCKKERDAIKKLDISKVPPVLAVHLKRFVFSFLGIYSITKTHFLHYLADLNSIWTHR